ncbi:unnamed protein product [Musa hybrid cultivar]
MPGPRMKRKSDKGCVRLHNVHARHRSSKKSENSPSEINTEVDASIQIHHDGNLSNTISSRMEQSGCDSTITGFDGASAELLNLSSSPPDPLSTERMLQSSSSTAIAPELETIFSPNFEDGDSQLNSTNHGYEVQNENPGLPNLVADEGDDGNSGFSDYQACSLLDFCFSESAPSLPFDDSMDFTDVSCHHYEFTTSDILTDVAERYMMLPFLGRNTETSGAHDNESIQEIMMNSNDAYLATHQESDMNYLSGDLGEIECLNPQLVFRTSPDLSREVSSSCPTLLQKETQGKPITLVLDLDETLVHSTLEYCDDADFTFPVFFNMKEHTVYVRRRPFLQMFLERVAQMFEIVIFTASLSIYASQLLDILDPDNKIISGRIYRESCIFSDDTYTKDLSILGVDLAKVVIIDNSPQVVFRLQVNNGIPIKSWFDDPSDHALVQLLPFLETLVDAEDVRPIIANRFSNKEQQQFV